MAQVILLSETVLKERSIIQDNVDMKVISPTILDVQEFYIIPILGTSLYNEIISQVETNTLTQPNRTLLDEYVLRTMIWYCRFELPLVMNYKHFNKSVGVQNAENLQPASIEEIFVIRDNAKNKAEYYADRTTKFLLANTTVYPLYLNQTDANIDTIFAKQNNFTSGMALGDGACCMGQYNFKGIKIEPSQFRDGCSPFC
jgi:hypothetical protein